MLIELMDYDCTAYHVNPANVVGCFFDPVGGGYYIDLVDGTQYKVSQDSYMRIIEWMRKDMEGKK